MEAVDQLVFVGDDQHGDAHAAHPLQKFHHLKAQFGVDVAGRLVRDDELGRMRQCAGHGHALLLAAGEELRVDVGLVFQMDQLQHVGHTLLDLSAADVGHVHGERDVLIDRHGGDEAEVLKDDAHLTAQIGDLVAADLRNILAVHQDTALAGLLLPEDELEQGGFACAGVAQQEDELAVVHMEVDVLQRGLRALFILLGNMFKIDHQFSCS